MKLRPVAARTKREGLRELGSTEISVFFFASSAIFRSPSHMLIKKQCVCVCVCAFRGQEVPKAEAQGQKTRSQIAMPKSVYNYIISKRSTQIHK